MIDVKDDEDECHDDEDAAGAECPDGVCPSALHRSDTRRWDTQKHTVFISFLFSVLPWLNYNHVTNGYSHFYILTTDLETRSW